MERKDLEEIAKVCVEKDIFVISDEIYSALTYNDEPHVSIATMPGMKERTILINGTYLIMLLSAWLVTWILTRLSLS
jgi:aminotransferase